MFDDKKFFQSLDKQFKEKKSLSELVSELPVYYAKKMKIECPDDQKEKVMSSIAEEIKETTDFARRRALISIAVNAKSGADDTIDKGRLGEECSRLREIFDAVDHQ